MRVPVSTPVRPNQHYDPGEGAQAEGADGFGEALFDVHPPGETRIDRGGMAWRMLGTLVRTWHDGERLVT